MATTYDTIIVGAGIGGSCLAALLARAGRRVLLCEREGVYRDRVRGEAMHPWGVCELRRIGMYDAIATCAAELPRWNTYLGDALVTDRDLPSTTRDAAPEIGFYHPEMQQVALEVAREAGADVLRSATVREVREARSSTSAGVVLEHEGRGSEHDAPLVVLANGRGSALARALGRTAHAEPAALSVAGLLLGDVPLALGTVRLTVSNSFDGGCILFPLGEGRVRAYVIQRHDALQLSGDARQAAFIERVCACDPDPEPLRQARPAGPLASFGGAAQWLEPLYRGGVVLLGDVAGTVDPTFGSGLSMAARDVRTLGEALLAHDDARVAAAYYAAERARYHAAQRRIEGWLRTILYTPGPPADAIRAEALPRMAAAPDLVGLGPDAPCDDAAREALFGPANHAVA